VTLSDRDTAVDVKDFLHIGKNTLELEMTGGDAPCETGAAFGRVELVGFNYDIITAVYVSSRTEGDAVRLRVKAETLEGGGATRAVATLVSPGGRVYYCGMSSGEGEILITEPNPWWPSQLGVQNLYRLTVNLYADGEIIDSADMRVGLTELEAKSAASPMPQLTVGGASFYMKAAVLGADDRYLPLLDNERMKTNLTECSAFGFNTVIIKDIGVYPSDSFFCLCDGLGLFAIPELASQEHLSSFLEAYRRCAYHVSFAAVMLTGDARRALLPDFLSEKVVLTAESLETLAECGGVTLPVWQSLTEMLPPDDRNLNSHALERISLIDNNAEMLFGLRDRFPSGLNEAYYAISLTEADRLSELIGGTRRHRGDFSYTVLPRLTDPSPAVSESLIDRFGRRKAHCYALTRLFSPVYVGAVADGTRVTFFVSNESREEKKLKFSYSVSSSDGRAAFRDGFALTVPPLSSMDILTSDFAEIAEGHLDEYYVAYSLSDSFITVSKGTLLFTPPKHFKFRRPNIRTELTGTGTHFILTLSSDVFARGVEIDFGNTKVEIEDNYFDITDRSPVRVDVVTEHATAIEVLRRELTVRSAYDIGRHTAPDGGNAPQKNIGYEEL